MMTSQSPTGPFSREDFQKLVDAPYGAAAKAIRHHDPLWGFNLGAAGQTIKWSVSFEREVIETGYALVEAETEEDALEAAALLDRRHVHPLDTEDRDASWVPVSAKPGR